MMLRSHLSPIFFITLLILSSSSCRHEEEPEVKEVFDSIANFPSIADSEVKNIIFHPREKRIKFKAKVEKGKHYRFYMHGYSMLNVGMNLYDSSQTVLLDIGRQANISYSASYVNLFAFYNEEVIIELISNSTIVYYEDFFLLFEEIKTESLTWKGLQYDYSGNWEVDASDNLVFYGKNSGITRWIRPKKDLNHPYFNEITIESNNYNDKTFVGLGVLCEEELHQSVNMPKSGGIFFTNKTTCQYWLKNTSGSIAYEHNFNEYLKDGKNVISTDMNSADWSHKLNGTEVFAKSLIYTGQKSYVMIMDYQTDSIVVSDWNITNQ